MTNLERWELKKGIKENLPRKHYVNAFRDELAENFRKHHFGACPKCPAYIVCEVQDDTLCVMKDDFPKWANHEEVVWQRFFEYVEREYKKRNGGKSV